MTESDLIDNSAEDEFDPSKPKALKKSKPWLKLLIEHDKAGFEVYQQKANNIDRMYANLERMAKMARDREFQIFWANIGVLAPSMYARTPIPVVTPRFRDRRPLPRTTSELLERSLSVNFEMDDLDSAMRHVRDDVGINARGVLWLTYEAEGRGKDFREYVCIEHLSRNDFKHDPARKWKEVDWVARCAWMTKSEMKKRFKSVDLSKVAFEVRKDDNDNTDGREKAAVWEIWSKSAKKIVWVTDGVDELLDEKDPPLKLEGFFPCPRPAYATVQRESLIPVPDYMFYKDQIEEVNELTGRIHALSEAIRVKGFYPSGESDLGDAIERAVKDHDNRAILVPVSNWAAFGDVAMKDTIVWLPIDQIAQVVTGLVALRQQVIADIYQITGLSDIMRGATDPNETLGAQEMKSQYGNVRIRDRQQELIRIARDASRIAGEIMAENFQPATLMAMAQMELPTDKVIAANVKELEQQGQQIQMQMQQMQMQMQEAQNDPQLMQQAQQKPEIAQKIMAEAQGKMQQMQQQLGQLQQQAQKISETVTIDQVMSLLREQRLRPFILDIETDSTIAADENAQKQRANEFLTSIGGLMSQMLPAIQAVPQTAPLMSEALKYAASQYRAGRQLDTAIDEFADQMTQMAGQSKADPEADQAKAQQAAEAQKVKIAQEAEAQKVKLAQETADAEQRRKQAEADHAKQMRERETNEKLANLQAEANQKAEAHAQALELGNLDIEKKRLEVQKLGGQIVHDAQKADIAAETAEHSMELGERSMEQKAKGMNGADDDAE
jgi:hypothetical protein